MCGRGGGTENSKGDDEAFARVDKGQIAVVNDNDVGERDECDARTKAMLYM